MTRAVLCISARTANGSSAPPAAFAFVPCAISSVRMAWSIARLRVSSGGSRARCSSRWPSTCRSVSTTKPRLVRSPINAASAPMANEPAYQTGLRRLALELSSFSRVSHHARWSVSSRAACKSNSRVVAERATRAWPWYSAWAAISPAWFTRMSAADLRRSASLSAARRSCAA